MKIYLVTVLVLFSSLAFGDLRPGTCSAPTIAEFQKTQAELAWDIYGTFASFDYTNDAVCVAVQRNCMKMTIEDGGQAGYYDAHTVYYITYGDRVIFASTSQYTDGTYGGNHGSANAEVLWEETFQRLSEATWCR